MSYQVYSGDYEVLASSTVISYNESPVEVRFGANNNLKLKFSFNSDDKEKRLESNLYGENAVEIKLFNFNNGLDEGNISPLKIGDVDGKDLSFSFRVAKLASGSSRTLTFTIYKHA